MDLNVDHLVYAVPDLEEGRDAIERLLGVRPAVGGRHPHLGSQNALLSLGPDVYLEVVAPDPGLPRPPRGVVFNMDGINRSYLSTWALRCEAIDDVAAQAASRGFEVGPLLHGSRERPDGTMLTWRLSDPYLMAFDGIVPFLIGWGDSPHPARSAPAAGKLMTLEARHPDAGGAAAALAALGVDLPVRTGPAPSLSARIQRVDDSVVTLQ